MIEYAELHVVSLPITVYAHQAQDLLGTRRRPAPCAGVVSCWRQRGYLSLRNGNGIRHLLERLSPAYQRVPDLRGRPQRDRPGRSTRLSRRLHQRASWRAGLYRQGGYVAGPRTAHVQGSGADQAHPHGCSGETHSPCTSGRYGHPGGGHRSRGWRRPFHLRFRLGISQSAFRQRTRTLPRRPPSTPAGVPRPHPEVLDRGRGHSTGRANIGKEKTSSPPRVH